jgi:hypothetical protein
MQVGGTYRFPAPEEWPTLAARSKEQLERAVRGRVESASLLAEMLEVINENGLTREQCDAVYLRFSRTLLIETRASYWSFLHSSTLRGARVDREAGRRVSHFSYLHHLAGIVPRDA